MKYILMILPAAAVVCGIFTGRLPEVERRCWRAPPVRSRWR